MRVLRENTATRVTVGPFIDVGDGYTPELALTATNEHLTFVVDDAGVPTLVLDAVATVAGANDLVHITNDNAGYYDLELTAAQTNYTGRAVLSINYLTDHLPVFHEFQIVSANVYDSLYTDGDLLQADATQISGSTNAADRLEASTLQVITGTVSSATDATQFLTDLESGGFTLTSNDQVIGRTIIFNNDTPTTAALQSQAATITDYIGSTGEVFVATNALTTAPAASDTFIIV